MPFSSKIIDKDGWPVPALMRDERAGLLVATIPAQHKHFTLKQFISTDGYENIDVDVGGSSITIWNGTGAADTGGDWARGGDAGQNESAASNHSGTNGLDTGITSDKDVTTFTNTALIGIDGYSFLSFWINAQNWPGDAEVDITWFNGSTAIGATLHDFDYANVVVGSWVNVKMPILDFNLTGAVDKVEFQWEKEDNIHAYIDDIELLSGSGTKSSTGIFRIASAPGEITEIHEIRLVINTATSGWNATDFTLIDGGLDAGLLFRWWDPTKNSTNDLPILSNAKLTRVLTNNLDLVGFFDIETTLDFLDSGRVLVLSLNLSSCPIHLFKDQVVDIVARDNLGAINNFRAYAIGCRRLESLQKDELEGC